jgi:hypothetical protein
MEVEGEYSSSRIPSPTLLLPSTPPPHNNPSLAAETESQTKNAFMAAIGLWKVHDEEKNGKYRLRERIVTLFWNLLSGGLLRYSRI